MNPKTWAEILSKIKILSQDRPSKDLPWDTLEDHMILLWDFPTSSYQYLVIILFNGGCYDWVSQNFCVLKYSTADSLALETLRNMFFNITGYLFSNHRRVFFQTIGLDAS